MYVLILYEEAAAINSQGVQYWNDVGVHGSGAFY